MCFVDPRRPQNTCGRAEGPQNTLLSRGRTNERKYMKYFIVPEPGRKPGARVTNSARLFTPGEKDSIADSKVVVIVGWVVISLISKIQRITGV